MDFDDPLSRRSMLTRCGGWFSALALAGCQTALDSTVPSSKSTGPAPKRELHAAEDYKKRVANFVEKRFVDPFVKEHETFSDPQKFAKELAKSANKVAVLIAQEFPVVTPDGTFMGAENVQAQALAVDQLQNAVRGIFRNSTQGMDIHDMGFFESPILSKMIKYKEPDLISIETLSEDYDSPIELFVETDEKALAYNFASAQFADLHKFINLITAKPEEFKEEIVWRINSPWIHYHGSCYNEQMILNLNGIDSFQKLLGYDDQTARLHIAVNEKLHQSMYRSYGTPGEAEKFRSSNEVCTEPIMGIDFKDNGQVEEALSDLATAMVVPRSFYAMFSHSHPFTQPLAAKIFTELTGADASKITAERIPEILNQVKQITGKDPDTLVESDEFKKICFDIAREVGERYRKNFAK